LAQKQKKLTNFCILPRLAVVKLTVFRSTKIENNFYDKYDKYSKYLHYGQKEGA
jgi:hypothetical protein